MNKLNRFVILHLFSLLNAMISTDVNIQKRVTKKHQIPRGGA